MAEHVYLETSQKYVVLISNPTQRIRSAVFTELSPARYRLPLEASSPSLNSGIADY